MCAPDLAIMYMRLGGRFDAQNHELGGCWVFRVRGEVRVALSFWVCASYCAS